MAIPFPPIIIASGLSCLVTQAYIEDNPASGLVLINPPSDSDPRPDVASKDDWQWPSFTYEPRFPILVLTDRANRSGESSANTSRIMEAASKGVRRGGKGVSVESLSDGVRGEKSRVVSLWSLSLGACSFNIADEPMGTDCGEVDGFMWFLKYINTYDLKLTCRESMHVVCNV